MFPGPVTYPANRTWWISRSRTDVEIGPSRALSLSLSYGRRRNRNPSTRGRVPATLKAKVQKRDDELDAVGPPAESRSKCRAQCRGFLATHSVYGATRQSRFSCLRRRFRIRITVSGPSESSSPMRADYAEYRDLLSASLPWLRSRVLRIQPALPFDRDHSPGIAEPRPANWQCPVVGHKRGRTLIGACRHGRSSFLLRLDA